MANLSNEFAAHLALLLDFHIDDEPDGQGQFADPVETVERLPSSALLVILASGQRLKVIVEAAE